MTFTVVVPANIAKLPADKLALALADSSIKSSQYAVHAVRSGREYFAAVVATLNDMLSSLSPHAAANFKVNGPVKVLRNACNREGSDFILTSSKNGGLSVISREENTKDTGKTRRDDKKPGPVKTTTPEPSETEESAEVRDNELDSLRADIARLQGELTAAAARESELRAALTSAESRAVAAESRADKAETRAKSAESALASLAKPAKPAKIQPTDADFRNIRESSAVAA